MVAISGQRLGPWHRRHPGSRGTAGRPPACPAPPPPSPTSSQLLLLFSSILFGSFFFGLRGGPSSLFRVRRCPAHVVCCGTIACGGEVSVLATLPLPPGGCGDSGAGAGRRNDFLPPTTDDRRRLLCSPLPPHRRRVWRTSEGRSRTLVDAKAPTRLRTHQEPILCCVSRQREEAEGDSGRG